MCETGPETQPELLLTEQVRDFRFGLPAAWGLMAKQLEQEELESFDGTRSLDKMLVHFSDSDPDEVFRL